MAEDSVRFYPQYSDMTILPASKSEIITDLNFSAYINIPHSNLQTEGEEDRLSYASFKVGWDNSILQLDSLRYGEFGRVRLTVRMAAASVRSKSVPILNTQSLDSKA
jgi:hypothetical protein